MGHIMSIEKIDLKIVIIRDSYGFNEISCPEINSIIKKNKPDYSIFLDPTTFQVYHKAKKGESQVSNLIKQIIDYAEKNKNLFETFTISEDEGPMICELNFFNKIITLPMGVSANKAYQNIVYKLGNK
jgi:hypothetical protein